MVDEAYEDDNYHTDFNMHKQWLRHAETNWQTVEEGTVLKKYPGAKSPDIRHLYHMEESKYWHSVGGIVNVQVGEQVPIHITEQNETDPRDRKSVV